MESIHQYEEQYLKAKIAYYDGNPFLTDAEFDVLEEFLKGKNSKVINQVGSKRKDFDFPHPSRMRSLSKIQMSQTESSKDYKIEEFIKWYDKRKKIVGASTLLASAKFDGNAINIIYRGGILSNILTRGDGNTGKDITKRLKSYLPEEIHSTIKLTNTDVLEIRAEVVIDLNLFNSKYAKDFANARNYIGGVLGADEEDLNKTSELKIMPIHYILNGNHIEPNNFSNNPVFHTNNSIFFEIDRYAQTIKLFEEIRLKYNYQLDGVVISFSEQYRKKLGENEHEPEWAVAIKFIPPEAITTVTDIEWNVSKNGELIPTVLLEPVFLDGSTIRRVSGYNAGYIVNKKIGKNAKLSIAKAGEIIPEVQKVIISSSNTNQLVTNCPACSSETEFDGIHLYCTNEDCIGKKAKQLSSAIKVLNIKGIGEKTIEPFAKTFNNIFELIRWARTEAVTVNGNIDQYGIKYGSRSHELFLNAFKNIKTINYSQIIQTLGYENVGDKLSTQIAREHAGLDFDYSNLEKELVAKLRSEKESNFIKSIVRDIELMGGIEINKPKIETNLNVVYACLTGSPKAFGFNVKQDFLAKYPNLQEISINDKKCQFLITDSYQSTSSKMKDAVKRGITIKTYGDF